MSSEQKPIRRIVTGHDANGVAKVLIDELTANARDIGRGSVSTLLWCSDAMPADIATGERVEDMGARTLGTPPPPNGTRFALNVWPPGVSGIMHRTETLDYVIILDGELDMELDDSVVKLKAGDIVVQRGTNHNWVNRGTVPARFAIVLVDAEPLGFGNPVGSKATPYAK
jgi:quercetin dioxygenase-like cupin family protein